MTNFEKIVEERANLIIRFDDCNHILDGNAQDLTALCEKAQIVGEMTKLNWAIDNLEL